MNDALANKLSGSTSAPEAPQPQFFDLSDTKDAQQLEALLNQKPQTRVVDTYETQLLELLILNNPPLQNMPEDREKQFATHRDEHFGSSEPWQAGKWVYLSWRHALLHILDDDAYQQVRTGRNRHLITPEEQTKFYNATIGIAGLSVGNSVALAIVQSGGGKHMRLADPDTLELTNLNRIRGSIAELTEPKVYMTARQIYELDPYADLKLFTDGITEENIAEFVTDLDVMVDEIDNLGIKIRIRQECKPQRIPIVMAADNGDGGILDVERHDLDDDIEFFHGRAKGDIADRVLNQELPQPLIGRIIGEELIGYDVTDSRMQESLLEIGQSIPTWPQLGTAAWLNGVAVAATVRRIITGQSVVNNRANLSLNSWLVPDWNAADAVKARAAKTTTFAKEFNARIDAFIKKISGN
ncbi:hypothetical protein CL628_02730 [bacterium]|nr:hypothetical protein [bacterium]